MKRIILIIIALCVAVGHAGAAVRDGASVARAGATQSAVVARTATPATTGRTGGVVNRDTPQANTRTGVSSRTDIKTNSNIARTARATTVARAATNTANNARTARTDTRTSNTGARSARAATQKSTARATTVSASESQTFGAGYNTCRDAYFTCMDQFCATQNDSYRRCVCSSKLTDVQKRERALGQAADQLTDFRDLNLEVIDKTPAEVKAMVSASAGEYVAEKAKDKSASASQLAGISDVLSKTKSNSLSTAGKLDIAGNINSIWSTTDLASGANLANLTGESLYNAVHSQCATLIADQCPSTATLNMVTSAYGMYIENDCTTLLNALNKQLNTANGTIRETERDMQSARLDNYDAHNSASINECIASVRADITADTACGADYVHCLDVTGLYLNRDTGEPIYSPEFYQLELQVSLAGDVLTNKENRALVAELQRKKIFAEHSLDSCTDLAADVWDEFLRQAITEIYQGQQERIRQVKNECLSVVSQCYDEQAQSLKDFTNIDEQNLLGQRMQLSETMCREKLDACSNLYGGGSDGMKELLTAMHNITDQKIAKECRTTLQQYAKDICAVIPNRDTLHAYPYGCRNYTPGSAMYASIAICNDIDIYSTSGAHTSPYSSAISPVDNVFNTIANIATVAATTGGYACPANKHYDNCNPGYYLSPASDSDTNYYPNIAPTQPNSCKACEKFSGGGCSCPGGTAAPDCSGYDCGDYKNSLYHKMVTYARQVCVRPDEASDPLPTAILEDVNVVMDSIRSDMAKQLAAECERQDGKWVDGEYQEGSSNGNLNQRFYSATGANTKWGYCLEDETAGTQ